MIFVPEQALERALGGAGKPAELAHVDMKAKLEDAKLKQFVDHPQLWPPTIAVRMVCLSVLQLFALFS